MSVFGSNTAYLAFYKTCYTCTVVQKYIHSDVLSCTCNIVNSHYSWALKCDHLRETIHWSKQINLVTGLLNYMHNWE